VVNQFLMTEGVVIQFLMPSKYVNHMLNDKINLHRKRRTGPTILKGQYSKIISIWISAWQ